MRPKFEECLECVNYHEDRDDICEVCEDGEMFEEFTLELNFHDARETA